MATSLTAYMGCAGLWHGTTMFGNDGGRTAARKDDPQHDTGMYFSKNASLMPKRRRPRLNPEGMGPAGNMGATRSVFSKQKRGRVHLKALCDVSVYLADDELKVERKRSFGAALDINVNGTDRGGGDWTTHALMPAKLAVIREATDENKDAAAEEDLSWEMVMLGEVEDDADWEDVAGAGAGGARAGEGRRSSWLDVATAGDGSDTDGAAAGARSEMFRESAAAGAAVAAKTERAKAAKAGRRTAGRVRGELTPREKAERQWQEGRSDEGARVVGKKLGKRLKGNHDRKKRGAGARQKQRQ